MPVRRNARFGPCSSKPRAPPAPPCRPETLGAALAATEWKGREEHPASAYEIAAGMQNGLALPDTLPQTVRDYFGRPFKILEGARWRPLLRRVYEYSAARPEAVVGASPTRPVTYARYAGEGHWEGTWSYANQVDALERMIAWFDRYLK